MATRRERIALNEAMFREGNERMAEWRERRDAPPSEKHWYLCECADPDCREHVPMTIPQYETVRADAMHFAVVPGHEIPDVESVVDRYDSYVVVEKDEDVRDIAEATDLRGG